MTADMPDPVKVAREAVFANADAIQRLVVNHTTAFTIALWGARAMQDAMAGRVRECDLRRIDWRGLFISVLDRMRHGGESREMGARWMAEAASRAILSALEPAGAQEGGYDPERDLEPCLEARLFVTPESLDAFMEANPLPPEPTPAPDVPGAAFWERAYNRRTGQAIEARARATAAEAERDKLKAEVERLREALAPFAAVADDYDDSESGDHEVWKDRGSTKTISLSFKLENYRKARAALSPAKAGG